MSDHYQIITRTLPGLGVFDTQAQFFKSRKLAGLPAIGYVAAASQLSLADSNEEAPIMLSHLYAIY